MSADGLLGTLVEQERAALDRWAEGDTRGYAARMADRATYFDHATPARLGGRDAITHHVGAFHGMFRVPRYEIVDPILHHDGDLAVLAFNWDPYDEEGQLIRRWNATSVYRKTEGEWRMIHAHWAMAGQT